jgi:acyl-CoA synthetase (AMP-forming)/AMP-acid ligase II
MLGQMMDIPLLISSLIVHADKHHGDTEIVTRTVEGPIHRYTYSDAHLRSRQLAGALEKLGVKHGDRIGTLAWNTHRHFEIYYAVSGMGAVCHTINPRLFPEQITYIANHAEDSYLFLDLTFVPLVEKLRPSLKSVKGFVIMTDKAHMPDSIPDAICYEDLIDSHSGDYVWPVFDERAASSLCYTSGTTGNPKGVLFQHRSTILHSYAECMPDVVNLSATDTLLPVVPMFHANAWGLPYACAMTGAKIVFPGAGMDGKSLFDLMEQEKVTLAAGVPTIWLGLLAHVKQNKTRFSTLKRTLIGGSACPPAMIRAFREEYDVQVLHAWGMTELSPLGTVCTFKSKHESLDSEEKLTLQNKQGRTVFGIDMKIVDADGNDLPWDGVAFGDLLSRGPWVVSDYFRGEGGNPLQRDGQGLEWFPTGDVATIDPDGYMQITDRSKDVIKTGGEWISSIDLENTAMAHPAVAEAAVISVAHPKWDERPLLVVVKKEGEQVSRDELLEFYQGKVAKWWIPDDVVFVDELPHTATGKLLKTKLREDFKEYKLPTA